ncbi:MAG: DUF2007 domain-containing protein [Proteobacteria bacterium]|nr:DUF2007 domain-containing protein [Pseudomonadota bacterium]
MEQPILIQTYSYRYEAELAQALLDTEGIESTIRADDAGGLGIGLAFSGGVRIFVDEKDAEWAREILAARKDSN